MTLTKLLLTAIAQYEAQFGEKPARLCLTTEQYDQLFAELAPYLFAKAKVDALDQFDGVPLEIQDEQTDGPNGRL